MRTEARPNMMSPPAASYADILGRWGKGDRDLQRVLNCTTVVRGGGGSEKAGQHGNDGCPTPSNLLYLKKTMVLANGVLVPVTAWHCGCTVLGPSLPTHTHPNLL